MAAKEDTFARPWTDHFRIQSDVDLDFVIGQQRGFPVGMPRRSPPEFKRRVLAAAQSYLAQLTSIDYTKRRYVRPTYMRTPLFYSVMWRVTI